MRLEKKSPLRTDARLPGETRVPSALKATTTQTTATQKQAPSSDVEALEKKTRTQREQTGGDVKATGKSLVAKSSPIGAFFSKEVALPDPNRVFNALLSLPESATAKDVDALWKLGEQQGAIKDGKLHPLDLTIEDRRLHAMMTMGSFEVALGVDRGELSALVKKSSALLMKSMRDDAGIPWGQIGAFLDPREKELVTEAMTTLGIPKKTAAAAIAGTPSGLTPFVPPDALKRGMAAAVDSIPMGTLLARVEHAITSGERPFDPFVRYILDDLQASKTPPTRQSVSEAALRTLLREYTGPDGNVDVRHVDVPGKRMRVFSPETLARSVVWEALCSSRPQTPEQIAERKQARTELDKTAVAVANAMHVDVDEARTQILRSLHSRHQSDSLHSSLMMDTSGRIDTRTGEPVSMELVLGKYLESWNTAAEAIPASLPMVDRAKARIPDDAFKGQLVLTIQHFLGPFVPLMEALKQKGALVEDMVHVGVPYSANTQVELALRAAGNDVRVPSTIDQMKSAIKDAMAEVIQRSKDEGKPILCIDDGGTVTELLQEVFPEEAHRFRIIEQTTRGITAATKAIEKGGFKPPVIVDVARSEAKSLEGAQIAPTAIDALENVLKARALALRFRTDVSVAKELSQSRPAVFGFGVIGASMARAFKDMGLDVAVWDKNPELRAQARAEGFFVPETRDEIFKGRDLVVGCTGFPSIEAADFPKFDPHTLLTSLSSKRIEFDATIREEARLDQPFDEKLSQVSGFNKLGTFAARASIGLPEQLERANNHTLVLQHIGREMREGPIVVNDMQPINFDHDVFVVPADRIQLTESLLLDGAYQAVLEADRSGIVPYDLERQKHVLADWDELEPA